MASKQDTAVRYESARLADYTDQTEVERGSVDLPFALLSMLLLTVGVIMVLSASFARAYYDPSGTTGGNATYYFVRQALFAMAMMTASIPLISDTSTRSTPYSRLASFLSATGSVMTG